ncbi:MAG: histidine--tRNA ligase [Archaeoglobus sp.]|nr:histidine--tRNA ligase [Archaeoglobus sp.]
MQIERPRGTRDFLPDEMEKRRAIERIMRRTAESYGYREVTTPTFEHLNLFTIKSGENIVQEIYAFKDKSGRDLALRPELTAPVMRLFVNECAVMPRPLRFYYFANCFRYENPQKGRYREFWQFGVELIGSDSYLADLEVIVLAYNIMKNLNLDFTLNIGHVGLLRKLLEDVDEARYRKITRMIDKNDIEGLEEYLSSEGFEGYIDRIKDLIGLKGGMEVIEHSREIIPEFDFSHLRNLCEGLEKLEIEYNLDFSIVRGLDYYTGVVFEAFAKRGLGAQNQICGGGSYRLTHLFGGADVPSTGFALGFDRIAEICEMKADSAESILVAYTPGMELEALKISERLRGSGKIVLSDVMERNLKKQLSFANTIGAKYAVIVAENEFKEGKVILRDLEKGEQVLVDISEIRKYF